MLLFCDGMDTYGTIADVASKGWSIPNQGAGNWTYSTTGGVNGGGALRCEQDDLNATITHAPNTATITKLRLAYWFKSGGNPGATDFHVCFYEPGRNMALTCEIMTSGDFRVWKSYPTTWNIISWLADSSGANLHDGGWHFIEWLVHENTSSGAVTVQVDGVTRLSFSGDIAYTGNRFQNINAVLFRAPDTEAYFDDIIIWDDTAGDGFTGALGGTRVIDTIRPNAAGASSQFTRTGGGSANYEAVDEVGLNDGDTTYVSSSTAGHKDLYGFSAMSLTPASIQAVVVNTVARTTAGSSTTFKAKARSVATESDGATKTVQAAAYATYQAAITTDPNTAGAWTESAVNAAEFGFEVVS